MSDKILERIIKGMIFCGIDQDRVFIQVTGRDNEILGEWEETIESRKDDDIVFALSRMKPIKDLKFIAPRIPFEWWHGQKVMESGTMNIKDCDSLNKSFSRIIFGVVASMFNFSNSA